MEIPDKEGGKMSIWCSFTNWVLLVKTEFI